MSERSDGDFLRGIFLVEAWDTAGALEAGLGHLSPEGDARALGSLLVLAHRLKGSAALHGFPGLSALAAVAEEQLERAPGTPGGERARMRRGLAEIVAIVKETLDRIGADGVEDSERMDAWMVRHDAASSRPPRDSGEPERAEDIAVVLGDLERFFIEGGDAPEYFGQEASEHLDVMGAALLGLERGGRQEEDLGALFRAAHTLKGAAYTVGCRPVGDLAHVVEDLLAEIREGRTEFGADAAEAILAAMDAVRLMLQGAGGSRAALADSLIRARKSLAMAAQSGAPAVESHGPALQRSVPALQSDQPLQLHEPGVRAYEPALPAHEPVVQAHERVAPAHEPVIPVQQPAVPSHQPADRALSVPSGRSLDVPVPVGPRPGIVADKVERIDPVGAPPIAAPPALARTAAAPQEARAARATSDQPGPSIRVKVDRLDSLMNLVGELMIARSRLDRRLGQLDRVTEVLRTTRTRMDRAIRDFERAHPTSSTMKLRRDPGDTTPPMPGGASIAEIFAELEFDRYDDTSVLARGVAELSADVGLAESQHAGLLRAVREDLALVQRLTTALRKEVTRARMVPVGRMFGRFARQVREVARAAGKLVALETHGETVEVDNAVVEQISDSLLHVVQNAVVHGIESEAERRRRGKPARGTVSLRADQQGGFILISVEDDGAGIDAGRLRTHAVAQGLLTSDAAAALSAAEALNLIFLPGFSTAPSVTTTAGRGVGLDVVRTNVSRVNGEIGVETEVGVRTRFTFKLPLTVAVADALMVRAGGEVLAIPLTTVGGMRFVDAPAIQPLGDREMVELDNQVMELIRMDRVLGLASTAPSPARVPVVVLRSGGLPFAVAVDELLAKEEIVIKSLGHFLDGAGPFAGATISGEGRVILLVDPTQLFELSRVVGESSRSAVVDAEREGLAARPRLDPRRIMLVDDSISVRRFVGQMLERAGFRVVTAVDGQDALEQLTERQVDAIITELEMPRVNGYALIDDLRRRETTRAVPVIVLTTRVGDKHVSLARRLGVRHYVAKPVEEGAFVALIRSVVSVPATSTLMPAASASS